MKLCCFFLHCPFYRFPIYNAIAEAFNCDYYFNDYVPYGSKPLDVNKLKGFRTFLRGFNMHYKEYVWNNGFFKLVRGNYSHFLLSGDPSYLLNWLIILYSKIFHKKVYLWCHGQKSPVKRKLTRFYIRLFYAHVDGIFVYGEHVIPNMVDIGIDKKKIHAIHNSLDTNVQTTLFDNIKPSTIYRDHFGNDNPVVIYIGRIQKRKKVDQLIKAVKELYNENYPVNLVIVGAAMDDNTMEQVANDLGLSDQIWFFGPSFDEKQNSELLYNADVCVSPGNVGLTCIHALSYGTPVVSNDNFNTQMPEYEAVKDGVTGSFFKENDIKDMAKHIKKWTGLSSDERMKLRQEARETILDSWSIKYQINMFNKVFNQ